MKKLCLILSALTVLFVTPAFSSTSDSLRAAATQGKLVFMIVTAPDTQGVDQVRSTLEQAQAITPGSIILELDRTDPAEATLVRKYRLATAPVPLVLVFDSNGILCSGRPGVGLNTVKVLSMVPSQSKSRVLKALQSHKAVLVTAYRKGMKMKDSVSACCKSASDKLAGKCESVLVNMDDTREFNFLRELKIDRESVEPVTVVINAKAQVTGKFAGPVQLTTLVAAATRQPRKSCCGSGSGKSCGPAGSSK